MSAYTIAACIALALCGAVATGLIAVAFRAWRQENRRRSALAESRAKVAELHAEVAELYAARAALDELHEPEERVTASASDPEDPEFYAVCKHCTGLMNDACPPSDRFWEVPWPCESAVVGGLVPRPDTTPVTGPFSEEAPF